MITFTFKALIIFFATTALFAHSVNADYIEPCQDDPDFEFKVTKAGQPKDCAWLKNKKLKQKVCQKERSKDGETKQTIETFCPYSCGACEKKKAECPRKKPENGKDCSKFAPGLTCDFNYRYTGGCGDEDPVTCSPQETFTCSNSLSWEAVNFIESSCDTRRLSIVGKRCDPDECPLEPPEGGTVCAKTGVTCPYDYQYQGCSINQGLECRPSIEAICNDDLEWELPPVEKLCSSSTDDQDPLIAEGVSCTPCPTVEPEGICPNKKPIAGKSCNIDPTIDCKYEFTPNGCGVFDIRCDPRWNLSCQEGTWVETPHDSILGRECSFTCPLSKPTPNSKCAKSTYSVGYSPTLSCDYDYVNTSCEAGGNKCTPTENYKCDDSWQLTNITPEECETPPPGYLDTCDPNRRRRQRRLLHRQRERR